MAELGSLVTRMSMAGNLSWKSPSTAIWSIGLAVDWIRPRAVYEPVYGGPPIVTPPSTTSRCP
jgi:hypothetical protein